MPRALAATVRAVAATGLAGACGGGTGPAEEGRAVVRAERDDGEEPFEVVFEIEG
jgi:hypothetical protein